MAKKEFTYRGKTLEELKGISAKEFADLVPSRQRRTMLREQSDEKRTFMKNISTGNNIKTHCRDIVILPSMVGKTIRVYNGKEFVAVIVQPEMIGHFIGEFALTRKRITHSAPGVGATRSTSSISVK